MPKIVRFHRLGGPEVLQFDDLPNPEPRAGEVRLKVAAIGLNRAEVLFREGHYIEQPKLPSLLGYEAAGTIEAVGPGVTGFKIGDKVTTMSAFSMTEYGVYGEVAIVPVHALAAWSEGLSAEQAASIWVQYMTAYGALVEFGKVKSGDTVLITAASSSVGYAAIQIAKAAGATAIATTRTSAKKANLLAHGADHVVATQEEDLPARVQEITGGRGANLVFDAVAGPYVETLVRSCARGATVFLYGSFDMSPTPFPLVEALGRDVSLRGYTVWPVITDPARLKRCQQYVLSGLKSGTLKPVLDRTFPFSEVVEAHRYMESNKQNGKITLKV
jgi:NADPH:quinone reductase